MPHLLIDHYVEDFEAWKPHFDDHGTFRGDHGSQGGVLFHAAGDPDHVVVLLEWDSTDEAREFAESDDLRETMAAAGVVGEPEVLFLQKVEDVAV